MSEKTFEVIAIERDGYDLRLIGEKMELLLSLSIPYDAIIIEEALAKQRSIEVTMKEKE